MGGKDQEKQGCGDKQGAAKGAKCFYEPRFESVRASLGRWGLPTRHLFVLPEESWTAETHTLVVVLEVTQQACLIGPQWDDRFVSDKLGITFLKAC